MERYVIRELILEIIEEIQRSGLLKSVDDMAYSEATAILREYYTSDDKYKDDRISTAMAVSEAVKAVSGDRYFRILPMYFEQEQTIEEIAERLDVDVSTIVRNKKRLCLEVYKQLK